MVFYNILVMQDSTCKVKLESEEVKMLAVVENYKYQRNYIKNAVYNLQIINNYINF